MGRPEADNARLDAMNVLGAGLSGANRYEDALSVQEAELSMRRRLGDSEANMLAVQGNLARTYRALERLEQALSLRRAVYSASLRLFGMDSRESLIEANGVANLLNDLKSFEEAKSLLRKIMPVAQRLLGESDELTIAIRMTYATSLYDDKGATLDDLREAVTTLEDGGRIARRVLGGTHPMTSGIERYLQNARAVLLTRQGVEMSIAALDELKAT